MDRLLENAGSYYDVSSFPDGETKRALQRVLNKKWGKLRTDDGPGAKNGADDKDGKKRKKFSQS